MYFHNPEPASSSIHLSYKHTHNTIIQSYTDILRHTHLHKHNVTPSPAESPVQAHAEDVTSVMEVQVESPRFLLHRMVGGHKSPKGM